MAWRDWIGTLFKKDKEQKIAEVAKGVSAGAVQPSGSGMPWDTSSSGLSVLGEMLSIDTELMQRYADYENMDDYIETSAALDIYADDATIPDSVHGKTIWGTSRDRVIRDIVDDCLHRRVRIEEDIWVAVRTLCKYGNCFAEILVNEIGVVGLNWLPVPTMRRIVDERGALIGFVQDVSGNFGFNQKSAIEAMKKGKLPEVDKEAGERPGVVFFYPWQIVHWRLRSKMMRAQYGYSVLDSARWVWKRLQLMEDTALVQKLTRAPGRYAFYVDTGDLPPREAMALVKKVKNSYKKKKLIDPTTGKLDFRFNPLCLSGDTRIPLLDGRVVELSDLVKEFEDGGRPWVYSIDVKNNGKLVPAPISWAGKTRENAELVKITLDNGEVIRCTPDHHFPLRSGGESKAGDLKPGDSMMPFRRYKDNISRVDGLKGKLNGYEKVYDPSDLKWKWCHRVVGEQILEARRGQVVHHRNFDRTNNDPGNLQVMSPEDHQSLHRKAGRTGGAAVSELRKQDPALNMRVKFPQSFVEGVRDLVIRNPESSMDDICSEATRSMLGILQDANSRRISSVHRHMLRKMVRAEGYSDFSEFREEVVGHNHKIVSVERLVEREDTYTLTVDGTHTFALDAGIYTFNSPHEDFFIPTRGGKESTRVEVMSGPDVQMMDDVEYFQKKLIAATKVPKSYLGLGESADETSKSLAAADVRFARACMRIQREFIMGMRKVIRIHMAALNIDPDSVQWQLKMSVPSAIFEMQQIEVMNAQASLASSMEDWASKPWILQHVFHFTEDDAAFIVREKAEESDSEAKNDAATQADIMRMYPGLEGADEKKDVGESKIGDEIAGLKKVFEESSSGYPEILRKIERLESRVSSMAKTSLVNGARRARG